MNIASFYKTVHSPYYIYAVNYTHKSAGIRMLHYLCHGLNSLGAEAYLIGCSEESAVLRTPLLRESDVIRHQKSNTTPIMVYPEVVNGNPLKMPKVVRWLLNKPGHLGGDEMFEDTDVVFSYSSEYVPENSSIPILYLPAADTAIFNNLNNPYDNNRNGSCFYGHKYFVKGGKLTKHVEGMTSLCQDVNLTPYEIAEILRRSEYLYCYEPSALVTEAILCGCPVVMIPTPFLEENLSQLPSGPGITSSLDADALQIAKNTVNKFIEELQGQIDWAEQLLRNFFWHTQSVLEERVDNKNDWADYVLDFIGKSHGVTVLKPKKRRSFNDKLWLQKNTLNEGKVSILAERMVNNWQSHPSFHLMMVLNANEMPFLSDTLDSLDKQLYNAWGLTIFSAMPQPDIFEETPDNIEWIQIHDNLNEEIDKAVKENQLDWLLQLLPGDTLSPHALLRFAETINENAEYRFIYSDEVADEAKNQILFKPDFNLELLRSTSYLGHALIVRRDAFEFIGGYTSFAYVYATDLAFKVYETYGEQAISHIDDVLYISKSAVVDNELLRNNELTVRYGHFFRLGINVELNQSKENNSFNIVYQHQSEPTPLVSIVIANRNNATAIARCVEELIANTSYQEYELIIVDQLSDVEDLDDIYQEIAQTLGARFSLLSYQEPNYAAMINLGVTQANGQYIVVLSSFVQTINGNWLTTMLHLAQRADVGVVGARIIDADENVIHGGGVLGLSDDVNGLLAGESIAEPGYMLRGHVKQEYSSVSSACYMVARDDFIAAGGLDNQALANSRYCVTDFCLKLAQTGLKTIWNPFATIFQDSGYAQSQNGVSEYVSTDVKSILLERWSEQFRHDPFFNKNLSLRESSFVPDLDMQITWDNRFNSNHPRILAFPFTSSGNGEYRVRAPLRVLEYEANAEVTVLPNHEFKTDPYVLSIFELHRAKPDTIILHNALHDDYIEFIERVKAETDISIVFGLDDRVDHLPDKNSRKKLVYRDMKHRLRRVLAHCDRLIVSTQPLADAYAEYCEDIVVIQNRLEKLRWGHLVSQRRQGDKLRVGWAGAQQHGGDLEIIVDVVKETADDVDWVFFGMCPDELRSYIKEQHDFVVFNDYPEKLASLNLDLAIAPLESHPFNDSKSNLRLLEYGILGWPVICSDVYPYHTGNPPVTHVVNDKNEWLVAIKDAIANPDGLQQKGDALREWVLKNYMLEDHIAEWLNAVTINQR